MTAWSTSMSTLGFALVHAIAAPGAALAQDVLTLRPSLGVSQVYDSNLFSTTSDRQTDVISRFTSGLESQRRSTALRLLGRYSFDMERFAEHPELSSANARQHAAFTAEYRPARRVTVEAGAEFWKTRTPSELNTVSGLTFTRAAARRVMAHASSTRQFSQVTSGKVDYSLTQDRLTAGARIRTQAATIGVDRRLSLRDKVRLRYRVHQFRFGTYGTSGSDSASQTLTAGWSREMTRHINLSVEGGPRVTGTSVEPELAASLSYRARRGDLSVVYCRTQATIIGLAGAARTESVTSTTSWTIWRSLQVRVAPGFFQNASSRRRADAYMVSAGLLHPIAKGLSFDVAFDSSLQRGSLFGPPAHEALVHHALLLRFVAAPSARPQ